MKSFRVFMLAAVIVFAAACASHAQNLIVSKTYYDTGLAFDGSQRLFIDGKGHWTGLRTLGPSAVL